MPIPHLWWKERDSAAVLGGPIRLGRHPSEQAFQGGLFWSMPQSQTLSLSGHAIHLGLFNFFGFEALSVFLNFPHFFEAGTLDLLDPQSCADPPPPPVSGLRRTWNPTSAGAAARRCSAGPSSVARRRTDGNRSGGSEPTRGRGGVVAE